MKLNTQELELMRQALYSKAYKLEQEINRAKSPSTRTDNKGKELQEVIALMVKVNQETDNLMFGKVGA